MSAVARAGLADHVVVDSGVIGGVRIACRDRAKGDAQMVNFEDLSAMLTEIGPMIDAREITAFDEQENWAIIPDEDPETVIWLSLRGQAGMAVVAAPLGTATEERAATTYRRMLEYNAAWSETQGMHVALDPETGELIQIQEIALAGVTAQHLAQMITHFRLETKTVRAVIETGGLGVSELGPDAQEADVSDQHIRV